MDHIDAFVGAMKNRVPASLPPNNGKSSGGRDWTRGFDPDWPATQEQRDVLHQARHKVATWINGDVLALVLAGNPGCGKTHLASAAVAWFNDPLYARLVDEPNLNADIRATYSGDGSEKAIIGQLRRTPRLVLDDIGTASVREDSIEWWQSILWRILDRRAERRMPLIITTNMHLLELTEWMGSRAASRLSGMLDSEDNFIDLFGIPDYRMRNWDKAGANK